MSSFLTTPLFGPSGAAKTVCIRATRLECSLARATDAAIRQWLEWSLYRLLNTVLQQHSAGLISQHIVRRTMAKMHKPTTQYPCGLTACLA